MCLIVWWSSKLDWFDTRKNGSIYKKATKMHYYQGNEEDTTKLHGCLFLYAFVFFRKSHAKVVAIGWWVYSFLCKKRKERRKFERRNLMTQGLYGVNTICKVFS